jgi:hypothetical protein
MRIGEDYVEITREVDRGVEERVLGSENVWPMRFNFRPISPLPKLWGCEHRSPN